jgi:hypothetical protein
MDNFHPQSEGLHLKEGHEESDLSVRGIITFAIFLVIGGIVANIGVLALIYGFESWHKKHDARLTPAEQQLQKQREVLQETEMRTPLPAGEATGVKPPPDYYGREKMEEHLGRTFPQPRLQYNDTYDMGVFRTSEEDWLKSTGRDTAGNVHIPVDRAMDLLVKGGLPQVSGPYLQPNNLPTAVPMVPAGPSRPLNK